MKLPFLVGLKDTYLPVQMCCFCAIFHFKTLFYLVLISRTFSFFDKRDDFDFEIVNFSFFDGDVHRSTSYGVYIFQLIQFARASSRVADFNTCNKLLTQKLPKQGHLYHKLRKTFSKFYCR